MDLIKPGSSSIENKYDFLYDTISIDDTSYFSHSPWYLENFIPYPTPVFKKYKRKNYPESKFPIIKIKFKSMVGKVKRKFKCFLVSQCKGYKSIMPLKVPYHLHPTEDNKVRIIGEESFDLDELVRKDCDLIKVVAIFEIVSTTFPKDIFEMLSSDEED